MYASAKGVDNLIATVDLNGKQIDGPTDEVLNMGSVKAKFEAFGWDVYDVDGHNIAQLIEAFEAKHVAGKPKMIVANTIKGKGISFMENNNEWHHNVLTKSKYEIALAELER